MPIAPTKIADTPSPPPVARQVHRFTEVVEPEVPPQKNPVRVSKSEIRRFDIADMELFGNWLYGRLRERYPHLTTKMFPAWVRQWIISNEMLFICNDNAVALAEICRDAMQVSPWVREVFVCAKEGFDEDGIALYPAIIDWARNLGAIRVFVGEDTDITLDVIEKSIKGIRLLSIKQSYFKLT